MIFGSLYVSATEEDRVVVRALEGSMNDPMFQTKPSISLGIECGITSTIINLDMDKARELRDKLDAVLIENKILKAV